MRYYVHITHTYAVDIPGEVTDEAKQNAELSAKASAEAGNAGEVWTEVEVGAEAMDGRA